MEQAWPEKLSEHLTFAEATHSERAEELGLDNTPPIDLLDNALRLAELFEASRTFLCDHFKQEIHLQWTSGFRCLKLNAAVGGSGAKPGEKLSAHTQFRAGDMHPEEIGVLPAFRALQASSLPFDKLILETDGSATWIHLQVAPACAVPRRACYTGTKSVFGSTFRAA